MSDVQAKFSGFEVAGVGAAELPRGFRCGGGTARIKASGKPDLALFVADPPCPAAGVFTTNAVFGAPVGWSRSRVPTAACGGVVINSGNANACTGAEGDAAAAAMAAAAAGIAGCEADAMLVCSTGVIGRPLPAEQLIATLPTLELGASAEHVDAAATAMMTTDTRPKVASHDVAGCDCRVVGIGKGAAMIAPDMATMLAVVMTDGVLQPTEASDLLKRVTERTFNSITVDGHTSTSDSVLLLASGQGGRCDPASLEAALTAVCGSLAEQIIRDAEGAEHCVLVRVSGAEDESAAHEIAVAIADDALVKTALAGNDPNWGRIVSKVGGSAFARDLAGLHVALNGTTIYEAGRGVSDETQLAAVSASMKTGEIVIAVELREGEGRAEILTTDLTQEYVRLNSEYTT